MQVIWIHSCQLCRSTDVNKPQEQSVADQIEESVPPFVYWWGTSSDKSVEAIDKRSPVTTWHVAMTTTTSLATELPSAQPTDEWTKTPEHKSRQLDEIVTLDVVSPFIVDNSVCAWRRWTVHGELRIAVVCSDAFQCTINDCLRPQRTLDCERKHRGLWTGTWSRIAIAVRLEPVLLLEQVRRNTEQRESTLNLLEWVISCRVTSLHPSPPLARSHSSARE